MTVSNTNRPTNLGVPAPATTDTTAATGTQPAAPKPAVDGFDGTSTVPSSAPARNGGLPDTLMEMPGGAKVGHGTDPGDYYCEHMFFQTQKEALKNGSSVVTNPRGEKLVGFLHIPSDAHTYVENSTYTQAERHADTRQVVGSALRGFYDDATQKVPKGPVRIMLNGYGTFESTRNNPTGDFVSHRENIDAAMKHAFGGDLVNPEGQPVASKDAAASTWQYVVRDPESRKLRTVLVQAQAFPVNDETINGKPGKSVQSAMGHFKPHAVMSMGVGTPDFTAEFHADDGGMRRVPKPAHDGGRAPTENLPDNRSLARAIMNGSKAPKAEAAAPTESPAAEPPSPAESVGTAARKILDEHGDRYGVEQPWFNVDPQHALPAGKDLGGLKGRWKCNLFGGNAMYAGGFEPPYYGNKGKGEYPNANQFYKWSDKYAGSSATRCTLR